MPEHVAYVWHSEFFFGLFILGGAAVIPLTWHVFVILQTRIGNGEHALVRLLRDHELAVTLTWWAMYAAALSLAWPAMKHDLFDAEPGPGASTVEPLQPTGPRGVPRRSPPP